MATDDEYTMPLTVDGLCPFLSRHDRICTIYAARPPVCWWYGEIPELPCGKLEPQAARLSFDQIVERIGKRLRMADERRRYQTTS
jgi:Fe-S-cluster containining protein